MLQKGDRVFIGNNSAATQDLCWAADSVAKDLGLVPLTYAGVRTAARESNVDREATDDLYMSKAWILILTGDQQSSLSDHWMLPELKHREARPVIVYINGSPAEKDVKAFELPVEPVVIKGSTDLAADLKKKLETLMRA